MNTLNILKREYHSLIRRSFINRISVRFSSNSNKNEENNIVPVTAEKREKEDKNQNTESLNKLNKLLQQMADDTATGKAKLDLAKPIRKRKEPETRQREPEVTFEKRLQSAAKDVAHSLGSDEKRVESELLTKLLNVSNKADTDTVTALSSIVQGMKIEKESKSSEQLSRAQQVRQVLTMAKRGDVRAKSISTKPEKRVRPKVPQRGTVEKLDIFGAEPLGLFRHDLKDEGVTNEKWRLLHEKELQLAVTHPPANYFQEIIQWTEAGKIWKFPIDNEQGMEEEKSVYFTEHVFLEKHLEPWCPAKGPVRHFMELVCVGLSKNPYMTVETKREHIEWYRKYFEDKIQLLKEIGAFPAQSKSETSASISDN